MLRALLLLFCLTICGVSSPPAQSEPVHAISMHGAPKYPDGFSHFSYVNPNAPKGGRLTLAALGSFDSLNPLIIKGEHVDGIRDFVFESLLTRGLDEPFTLYGRLAQHIEVPNDRSSITFHLNPEARFSDGEAVTADDILFSYRVLKKHGRPNHRTYYKKVVKTERLSDLSVRFILDDSGDREMPLILGLMPILPAHIYTEDTFSRTSLKAPIGSGPYRVGKVQAGRSITYVRDSNWWGRNLGVSKGRFNFDEVRFDYYREASAMFEAFLNGSVDVRPEQDPSRWASGYDVPPVRDGRIVRKNIEIGLPAGMTGFVFNTRREVFADPRVRRALIHMFNFEWMNGNLFHGLYERNQSYFSRSILASSGLEADQHERFLLSPFRKAVRPGIISGRYQFPASDGTAENRSNWWEALQLLKTADYHVKDGRLVHKKNGKQLSFELLAASNAQERIFLGYKSDLARLGIDARIRVVDSAQYQARRNDYDFDMIQMRWPSSLSPGNEQLFRWSSKSAQTKGSYNLAGVQSPAVDAMIQAMLEATAEEEFVSSVRALDRVLLSGDYVIPLYYLPHQWVAHWRRLAHPKRHSLFGYQLDTWWSQEAKEK